MHMADRTLFDKSKVDADQIAFKVAPLAERMRPKKLSEIVGQDKAVGPGSMLAEALAAGFVPSMIIWGPPGSGKTTLAKIIALELNMPFVAFSAVLSGVKEVREVIAQARQTLATQKKATILFVDEIHRFNKGQQDSFLPHVESGVLILFGATTENPSFEVNAALLSRCRVVVLEPLSEEALAEICRKAIADAKRGLNMPDLVVEPEAMSHLCRSADGDARRALTALEIAVYSIRKPADGSVKTLTLADIERASSRKALRHDKGAEEHYNVVSAFIKSMRASDPDAAVYWMARMLDAGEDPLFVARRMVILASEDIGNADPRALELAVAAMHAVHFVGMPEARIILSQAVIYLAVAPKSNAGYMAISEALSDVAEYGSLAVPLHLRNAPTKLMKDLGYSKGYQYDHGSEGAHSGQQCLPDRLVDRTYYRPSDRGIEERISKRLEELRQRKKR